MIPKELLDRVQQEVIRRANTTGIHPVEIQQDMAYLVVAAAVANKEYALIGKANHLIVEDLVGVATSALQIAAAMEER